MIVINQVLTQLLSSSRVKYNILLVTIIGSVTKTAQSVVNNLKLHEAYDILESMKRLAEEGILQYYSMSCLAFLFFKTGFH